ncbi:MAG: two-component regulator propeller domain-containing protein [Luteolibacter sp.]
MFVPIRSFLAVILLVGSCSVPVFSQSIPVAEDHVLRTWEMEDGLPSNTVSGVVQTPDGFLWIATPKALARFDGIRFVTFFTGRPDVEPTDFHTRDREIWLGFRAGGAARRQGCDFGETVPVLPRNAPPDWLRLQLDMPDKPVWYDWPEGRTVTCWMDGQLHEFKGAVRTGPNGELTIIADSSGQIWNPVGDKTIRENARFQAIVPQAGSRASLAPARDGGLWTAAGNQLVHQHPDGRKEPVANLSQIGGESSVNMLLEDADGAVWIATRGSGLIRWRNGSLARVPTSHNDVLSLAQDRDGNLWAGTHGGGLDQLRPRRFYLHKAEEGLPGDNLVSVCEDSEGCLWLAPSFNPPLRSCEPDRRQFRSPSNWNQPLFTRFVSAMCPDPAGGVWFACSNGPLRRWKDGHFVTESLWEPASSLLMDRKGILWVATVRGGLVRHEITGDRHISTDGGLVRARALAEDGEGRIWVGTEDGLVFLRKNAGFVPVPLPGAHVGESIRFIVPDNTGSVWIGALGGGLYRWRGGGIDRLSAESGLPTSDLRSLLVDSNEDFWFGTEKGLFRVARHELESVIEGRDSPARVLAYGRRDGIPSMEFEPGFRNATARTKDGHLWFATYRGALEVAPSPPAPATVSPAVWIDQVSVGDRVLQSGGGKKIELAPKPGPLRISYTLPALNQPERIRFRYRLAGFGNGEWTSASTERSATFQNLPPGVYQFEVGAAEEDGPWHRENAILRFTVAAAWWETPWFRALQVISGVAVLAGFIWLLVRRRMKSRLRMLRQENALERERTRIARDIHDEVGANLTQIAIAGKLAKLESSGASSEHLDEISLATRNTADALDEIVWAVNPRHDTVASLAEYISKFASGFLGSAGIVCKLEIPGDLPSIPMASKRRHHLYLVVKEALNNAVKYSGASQVKLKIEHETNQLSVIVEDNGCGFDSNVEPADANGLRNMRDRMADAGGSCLVTSRPGEGTSITFVLPIQGG